MEFPVDTLVSVTHGQLEFSGHAHMDKLLHANPDHAHYFLLPSGRKVGIHLSSVGFVPLYGANLEHKVLALFAPEDPLTAVALLLSEQWYAVENILRTANPAREGLHQVRSVVERVVLYVLNRIVYRTSEMAASDVPFLCHDKNDYAKILWKGGEAVGFYSVKNKGSWNQFYHLPVMNSIFVRKGHRGNGHGLQMLEDFVDSYKEDELGLKYPLSPAMSQVCRRYLARYPADVDLLWEVEGVGGPYQRTQLASRLRAQVRTADAHKGGHHQDNHEKGAMAKGEVEESTLDLTEEAVVKPLPSEEVYRRPISTRTRSSEHRWRKRVREEPVEGASETQPPKISRGAEPETVEPPTAVISVVEQESGEEEVKVPPAGGMAAASETVAVEQEAKLLVMGVNGSGAKAETVAEKAEEEAELSFQNGTATEEEEEVLDGEKEAEEPGAIDAVDALQESSAEQMVEKWEEEVLAGLAEKRAMEVDPAPEEQTEEFEDQREEETEGVKGEEEVTRAGQEGVKGEEEVARAGQEGGIVEDTEDDDTCFALEGGAGRGRIFCFGGRT
ncbi:soluble lamin-associated protein of 75 kDa [Brachyhypopomus gauderio]|uniref:soluble lamin-associated protein of 75 kDa n=1 Tax=Brachyhypopomus gauderio TaxID=698409 RepID=UPI00404363E6